MPTKTYAALGGALFATVVLASPALAEDWIVSVGGQVNAAPPYEGAGYDLFLPLPTLGIRKAGQPERPPIAGDAPGIAVISKSWISFGPDIRFRGSRDDKDLRVGLDKVGVADPSMVADDSTPLLAVQAHPVGRPQGEEQARFGGDPDLVQADPLVLVVA